jgi:co-chaperonin GroES (HSP10)
MRPINRFLFVKNIKHDEKVGNIILPKTEEMNVPKYGEVKYAFDHNTMTVKEGDRIIFEPNTGTATYVDGELLHIIQERNVLRVL